MYRLSLLLLVFLVNSMDAQVTYFAIEKLDSDQHGFLKAAKRTENNIEKAILYYPSTEVVDRETFVDIEAERERQKSESFIDGNYVEQGKSNGAQYIVYPSYESASRTLTIKIVDVTTSTLSHSQDYPLKHFVDKDGNIETVSYTHLRAHETEADLVCRLLLEKKK